LKTLRLLFWLRWRIAMNTTSRRGRWGVILITVLLGLAMAPIYVGGAIGAFAYTSHAGAPALLVVFGICQFAILWVSLLTGAMGRLFELDKLKRYPVRPLDVFAINVLASLSEPVVLMTMPALAAAGFGVARHAGVLAGLAAGGGGVLLLLITAALLQLLLALLDDLLRREWMRYVAAFFFTATVIGFQVVVRGSSTKLAAEARRAGFSPEQLGQRLMELFARVPTVAAPATLAGARAGGPFVDPWLALGVCLVLLVVPIGLGARFMATGSRRAAVGGGGRRGRAGSARGGFAARWPGFTATQSLLLGREFLYVIRTPALLYQMAVVLIAIIALSIVRTANTGPAGGAFLPMFIMTGTLAGRNLMLWGYDGPGVRTLFLLPFKARDLVLTKNVMWLASALFEATVVFVFMALTRPRQEVALLPLFATGYVAVALVGGVMGSWVSITRPIKPPQQGMARRSPGGVVGLVAFLVILLVAGAVVLAVLAVRALTPDAYDQAASLAVTTLLLLVSAAVWWIALDRNADTLERHREGMIDVLAKSADA
jgi:hypothetical protein